MKLSAAIFASLATLALVGCGANTSIPTKTTTTGPTSGQPDQPATLDEPDAYFDSFVKTSTGECGTNPYFTDLSPIGNLVLKQDYAGRDVIVELYMYLNADHSYEARYAEYTVTEYLSDRQPSGFYHSDKFDKFKMLTGKWHVDGTQIFFDDLGVGSHATYDNMKAIEFTFSQDQLSAGLAGKSFFLLRGYSHWDFVQDNNPCPGSGAIGTRVLK